MTDMNILARDLTRFIPNALVDAGRTNAHDAFLTIGDLTVRVVGKAGNRIEVRGFTRLGEGVLHYSERPALGTMTAAADKKPETIAREIVRKIVEPAKPVLETIRTKLARHQMSRAGLTHFRAVMEAQAPYARLGNVNDPSATTCAVSIHKGDCYLSGDLRDDGSLYVNRLGNIPQHRVAAVMAALFD